MRPLDLVSIKTACVTPPNLGTASADVGGFDPVRTMAARDLSRLPLTGTLGSARFR
jgi:hypothetical protein